MRIHRGWSLTKHTRPMEWVVVAGLRVLHWGFETVMQKLCRSRGCLNFAARCFEGAAIGLMQVATAEAFRSMTDFARLRATRLLTAKVGTSSRTCRVLLTRR